MGASGSSVFDGVLQAAPDMALALAGVDGLRALVTDWDFDEAGFAEYVGPALELLARLLQGSAEFDTQLQARATASVHAQDMGKQSSCKRLLRGVLALPMCNRGCFASGSIVWRSSFTLHGCHKWVPAPFEYPSTPPEARDNVVLSFLQRASTHVGQCNVVGHHFA